VFLYGRAFTPCFGMRLGGVSGGRVTQGCLHRDRGPGKIWVGNGADGYSDVTGKALALPVLSAVRVHAVDLPANVICSRKEGEGNERCLV
jgi:hypothetical protein